MPKKIVSPAELSGALTESGEGHHEKVEEAFEQGLLSDPRFLSDVVAGVENRNTYLADFIAETVLPEIGRKALAPLVSDLRMIFSNSSTLLKRLAEEMVAFSSCPSCAGAAPS